MTNTITPEEGNRLIAERVMGWELNTEVWFHGCTLMFIDDKQGRMPYTPFTDLTQAWEALEKWCGDTKLYCLANFDNERDEVTNIVSCAINNKKDPVLTEILATHTNPATAICLALLQATEQKED